MAPQKKAKKSKDKSALTLHKFFTSPGAGPSQKPNPPKSSKKSTPNKRKAVSDPKEIIVIDSDSDVEVGVIRTTQKKRRRSESVELLPNGPQAIKRVNTVASALPALAATVGPTLSFGKPSALLSESGPATPSVSFGVPSALLAGGPTARSTSLFGMPSSLLPDQPAFVSDDCPSPAVTEVNAGMDFVGEDDWGMGDDEIGVNPDDDDDEATQIDEPDAVEVSSCPLCQKVLEELSETVRTFLS
jgi:hypothetical protein